jgi:FKBP-type peptidyl-prolyl cis-trans isomerase
MVMNMTAIALLFMLTICAGYQIVTTDSGLKIEYVSSTNECEIEANNGSILNVHYTGSFINGTKFDSSYDRDEPLKLILGECPSTLIIGWVEGLQGMCVGEGRKLIIPPNLGYGNKGKGVIPGNTTLYFDINLVDMDSNPTPEKLQEIEKKYNCKPNDS